MQGSEVYQGSLVKGILLNIALNAFIALVWIPVCSVQADMMQELGTVIALGAIFLGLTQIVHVLPLAVYFYRRGQLRTVKGIFIAAAIVFLIWLGILLFSGVFY